MEAGEAVEQGGGSKIVGGNENLEKARKSLLIVLVSVPQQC